MELLCREQGWPLRFRDIHLAGFTAVEPQYKKALRDWHNMFSSCHNGFPYKQKPCYNEFVGKVKIHRFISVWC